MAQIDIEGTVYWESGLPLEQSGRIEGAVVKYRTVSASGSVATDDDGDFKITGIDDTEDLSLVLLHESARSKKIEKKAGEFADHLAIRLPPIEGRASSWIGGFTLIIFSILLVILTSVYLSAHKDSANSATEQYSALILALKSVPTAVESANDGTLSAALEDVRTAKQSVDRLRSPASDEIAGLIESIVTYKVAADADNIDDLTAMTTDAVNKLRDPEDRYFWSGWPWIMVEAWSWGLFGVLLTKIIRIGWYLRISSYYSRGTWMHLAHVVATPFLALIAVLVLSFLKLESETQTIVDLANPLFMVITACLLSTNPWGLWDFILGQGDALRDKAEKVK